MVDSYYKKNTSTHVAILEDRKNNKKFVLKQGMNHKAFGAVIREKVAADIALAAGIGVNEVIIIPTNIPFLGKKDLDRPATLHSFVPGIIAKSFFKEGEGPDIKQYNRSGQHGKQRGLRRATIKHMAAHPDLSALAAFDTFIGNHDRSLRNYSYDEKSNCFFGFDHESTFAVKIAEYAYNLFCKMVKENCEKELSIDEINGLIIYQAMLKKLIIMYPPEIIFLEMVKAKTEMGQDNYTLREKKKRFLEDNYAICKQIVAILDVLLERCKYEGLVL